MHSIQDVSAEQLAKLCHDYHEALAHNGQGNGERNSWDRIPQQERKLMIAATRLALLELASATADARSKRQYFAIPGEADWGC
jgi:hypothetical protein